MPETKQNTTELYQLDPVGKTYKSAAALYKIVEDAFKENPVAINGRNLGDVGRDYAAFYAKLYAETQAKNPALLQDTGLTSPATQVQAPHDGCPRAYLSYPTIYISSYPKKNGKPAFYLYSPVDYRGNHFVPKSGKKLDAQQAEQVGETLFAGGWNSPASVFQMQGSGVATPDDFVAGTSNPTNDDHWGSRTVVCFIAEGRSLECVEDLERRKKEWGDACSAVSEALKMAAPLSYGDAARALIASGEEFYINSGQRYGGELRSKTEFTFSVRQKGNLDFMKGGQPVPLVNNACFLVEDTSYGEYRAVPNPSTPKGQELKKLFDAVPPVPYQTDYPELLGNFFMTQDKIDLAIGTDGAVPRVRTLEGKTVLVYNCDVGADRNGFCPPGARPLDTALYRWLDRDEGDRNLHIQPPPMPERLAKIFAEQFGEQCARPPAPTWRAPSSGAAPSPSG